ncbi:hypothetical protein [Burkholderia pyrrocinia]|uniref:hypothetical protein n=1 Tax=Burkholderia pyrrocinia TaxID=60550 RepID=UPI002AAF428C|nr:hypothetical protein [Burkholderia pyrrocinia]
MSLHKSGIFGRRSLTKAVLLRLSIDQVHRLPLNQHLALAALRARRARGDRHVVDRAVSRVRPACWLRQCRAVSISGGYARPDRRTGRAGNAWQLLNDERVPIKMLLVTHDAQLTAVPTFRYLETWE